MREGKGAGQPIIPQEQFATVNVGWSGREDLNLRHPAPKAGALPGCATPRRTYHLWNLAFDHLFSWIRIIRYIQDNRRLIAVVPTRLAPGQTL